MTWVAAVLVVASLTVVLVLGGRFLLSWTGAAPADAASARLYEFVAGLLLLHALLTAYDLAGLRWTRGTVLGGLTVFALAGLARGRRRDSPGGPVEPGWGDGVALAAVIASAFAALALWSTNPDFVYHWGIKGHRYFLVGGIDRVWLGEPWNGPLHPGYPNLLPGLFVATALVAGGFDEPAMLLWQAVFVLAAAVAARATLRSTGASRAGLQGGVALVALTMATVDVGLRLAGGPDLLLALALLLALPPLLRPATTEVPPGSDAPVAALAAALAACAKFEGAWLAVLVVGAWVGSQRRRLRPATVVGAMLPAALLAGPWWIEAGLRGWLRPAGTGAPEPGQAGAVLDALAEATLHPRWHGLAVLGLAAGLALLFTPRWRPAALVGILQLAVYAALYLTARKDAIFWVQSSFPRLLVHVVPAFLVLAVAAVDRWRPAALRRR
ncbi:MAG: hypothetical protein KDD11_05005 [Acidobacteria bacterium]|nr:hypothetical protein [Acidobacteriota bacterium]